MSIVCHLTIATQLRVSHSNSLPPFPTPLRSFSLWTINGGFLIQEDRYKNSIMSFSFILFPDHANHANRKSRD